MGMFCDVVLEGGPYTHKYRVEQFHFHWGHNSQVGAEHVINGKIYAAEVSSIYSPAFYSLGWPYITTQFLAMTP